MGMSFRSTSGKRCIVNSTPSTSYDRYWEGRKDFGTMVSHVRRLLFLLTRYLVDPYPTRWLHGHP